MGAPRAGPGTGPDTLRINRNASTIVLVKQDQSQASQRNRAFS
jgi:hypothetical protein